MNSTQVSREPLTDAEILERFPRMRKDTAMRAFMNNLAKALTDRGYEGLKVTPYTANVTDNFFGSDIPVISGYNLMQTTPLNPPRTTIITEKRVFGLFKRKVVQEDETRKLVHGHIEDPEIIVIANERDLVTACEAAAKEADIRVSYDF